MILKTDFSLKNYNTFGIDCLTNKFVSFETENEIHEFLSNNEIEVEKILILGGGSNILFSQNFDGIVFKSEIKGIRVVARGEKDVYLEIGSGVIWEDLVNYAIEKGYGGIENLTLIPGTVGAAPIQNIGAYGVEFEEVFESLEGINLLNGEKLKFGKAECEFGYRDSIFKRVHKNKLFITKVIIKLNLKPILKINYRAIQDEIKNYKPELNIKLVSEIVRKIRLSKLPDPNKMGNAGSFFKNPIIKKDQFDLLKVKYKDLVFFEIDDETFKIPAGWLIEKIGYKGKRFGNVGVHKDQALVLVNYGNANGNEILELAKDIQNKIKDAFNISLEFEVNII
jgi:UDP-N-acetylmuramate dehydrogenase